MCMITQALGCTRPLKLLRSHWEHVALHSDLEEKKKKKTKERCMATGSMEDLVVSWMSLLFSCTQCGIKL